MVKRDLEKEKQLELAAVWGSEVSGGARFPKRKGSQHKSVPAADAEDDDAAELAAAAEVPSDADSEASLVRDGLEGGASRAAKKKEASRRRSAEYRLHCFVEPGTERNDVRMVFEAYEPKVDLRTSQKGNLLNKAQYAVLTFRNKALALHAAKTLEGTNQRDLLGVRSLHLSLMLNRAQSKIARMRRKRSAKRETQEQRAAREAASDLAFVRDFVKQHAKTRKGKSAE